MKRPEFIAELSANHNGSIDRAILLIKQAKAVGADAVKFQLFDPTKMAPAHLLLDTGPWAGRQARSLYAEAMTPRQWFPQLISAAETEQIPWFSSVFDLDGLAYLESLGCPRYKIASFEILDLDLIAEVGRTGKPTIISTGMSTWAEIVHAVYTRGIGIDQPAKLTLLKCTSAYPAPIADANVQTIQHMAAVFGTCDVGLSDHTMGTTAAIVATALGADMIEKHLTLCRSDGGPDAAFSSEPHEFAQMVIACTQASKALGEVHYGPTESEAPQLPLRGRTLQARKGDHEDHNDGT